MTPQKRHFQAARGNREIAEIAEHEVAGKA